jgi:hypothetical protein
MGSYGRFFMGEFSKNAMTPNLALETSGSWSKHPKRFLFYDA